MNQEGYYNHIRFDVINLVPKDVRSILSIGTGTARTEAELMRRGKEVLCVESSPVAATEAKRNGCVVIISDIQEKNIDFGDQRFDCIIFADVLEHLIDPEGVMAWVVNYLVPGGCVIVSVPNFRHYSVFHALYIRGIIDYVDAGIFDRTHVRITTSKSVEKWLEEVSLKVDIKNYIMGRKQKIINMMTLGIFKEFLSSQCVLRGRKPV